MVLALCATLAASPGPCAEPPEFDPVALAGAATDYKGWQVTKFRLRGRIDDDLRDRIKSGLALSGERELLGTDYPLLYPKTLEADLERTHLLLARTGYPYAELAVELTPRTDKRDIEVTFVIEPGPPVLVHHLDLVGMPDWLEPPRDALRLTPGQRIRDEAVEADLSDLRSRLREAGHTHAEVRTAITRHDEYSVNVAYQADPGPRFEIGTTNVRGAPGDLVALVRSTVDAPTGEIFKPSVLDRASTRLRQLDLFRQIRFDTQAERVSEADSIAQATAKPRRPRIHITVDLVPRDMRSFEVGLGYWTDDLAQIQTRWKHRNLLGKGRGLEVRGSASRYVQEVGALAWVPKFLDPQTKATLSAERARNDEGSYVVIDNTTEFAAIHTPRIGTTFRGSVSLSFIELDVGAENLDEFQEGGGLQTVFSLLARRETPDDRFYPTQGFISWIRGDWAPSQRLANAPFILGESYLSGYLSLAENLVWATRVSYGMAKPVDGALDLLPNYRFFAGGSTSMRGFKRRRLGPLDDDGDPLGGEAKLEFGTELRFPLVWLLRGAAFFDAGQVWRRHTDVALADLELAVGGGLMFVSPVGPIRTDLGYRLTDVIQDQPELVLHISIGQPF